MGLQRVPLNDFAFAVGFNGEGYYGTVQSVLLSCLLVVGEGTCLDEQRGEGGIIQSLHF